MIFNKDDNGPQELKDILGFIDRSFEFANLTTYIGFAEREMKKIISPGVFDVAKNHYDSENYKIDPVVEEEGEGEGEEEHPEYVILDELVDKIQLPVALLAYRRYVSSNDVIHTDRGRKIFITEEEKTAFEWQIERDNQNLISLANEATDVLLEFLDAHIDDTVGEDEPVALIPWGTSPAYEQSKSLLVNTVEEFEKVFPIKGSRMVFIAMVPFLRYIQDTVIKPCFSTEKFEEILEEILDGDIDEDNAEIIKLAAHPLVMIGLSVAIGRLSIDILPDGIFQNVITQTVRSKSPAPRIDRQAVSQYLRSEGMISLRMLQEYLRKSNAEAAGIDFVEEDLNPGLDSHNKNVWL